jgi:DNA-binding transcriptional MocR family regulator
MSSPSRRGLSAAPQRHLANAFAGLGKKAGVLLGRSGAKDAVDAALVCLAADGDDILTSDPGDLRALAEAAGLHIDLVPV